MGGCALRKAGTLSSSHPCGTAVDSTTVAGLCNIQAHRAYEHSAAGDKCTAAVREAFLTNRLKLDQRCPLDERQLYSLTKSWKAINRNMTITAINMFVR